jgi:hypothetical protein
MVCEMLGEIPGGRGILHPWLFATQESNTLMSGYPISSCLCDNRNLRVWAARELSVRG